MRLRNKATNISNKYKIQLQPIQPEWDKFLLTLEKDFLDILHEVLSCKSGQQQQTISNIMSSTPNENMNQCNTVIDNRTTALTTFKSFGSQHIWSTWVWMHLA